MIEPTKSDMSEMLLLLLQRECDEWRQQHENLLALYQEQVAMVAMLQAEVQERRGR